MSDIALTSPHPREEDAHGAALRPLSLADFTGQREVRENLQVFISAAKSRNESLDHTLFYGPPGLGKTTLAQIVSRELGVGFRPTTGPILTKPGDLAAILTALQPNDVLFIDEIHRLNAAVEEMLYTAMEDFKLDLVIGEGPAARSIRIDLPRFTLIGATTRLGLLTGPLRDRFGIPLRLQFYPVEDLQKVIERGAHLLDTPITQDGAFEIARRSRGTPRISMRLLRRVRDFAHASGNQTIERELADHSLKRLEVDALGLDSADRRYLHYIADFYSGGPVGIDTIAAGLSEQRDVLEEVIEPFLLQIGFLQRTPRGRMITPAAFNHLGLQPPAPLVSQLNLLSQELLLSE